METKEKNNRKHFLKLTVKNVLILLAFFVFFTYLIQVYFLYFDKSKTYGKQELKEVEQEKNNENLNISSAETIDIDQIIKQNAGENKRQEIEKQEVELEYLTKYKTNPELPKGMVQVVQEGRTGSQEIIIQKTYENEELVSEEQISAKVKKASLNKIVEVGGAKYSRDYIVKVGDTVYVTAANTAIMYEPNENSKKVATLNQGVALKVVAIQDGWYSISSNGTYGWVKSESTSFMDPNSSYEPETKTNNSANNNKKTSSTKKEKNKNELISKLSFDMKLNEPSGLSLEQFKKILTDDKDKDNVMVDNAEYFYYIESQYNINGVFVAAIAAHESAWGTSKIAKNKKNLFGYGAYDSGPYKGAYDFANYSESIDLIARVLVKYYLNPAGTKIYDGEIASGKYYSTPTLTGVNSKYASDKGWANKVYQHMQYLYNKL